ncbi:MAG: hypothetical protein F4X76_12955 [Chloroflexi bacterium]|nr:hypothetical protein [Chloroflexota bacterium]
MAVWPDYAEVVARDYGVRDAPGVRRTRFEDGAVRQELAYTESFTRRRVVALLESDAHRVSFRTWAADHAHTWFTWADPEDGVQRRVRVVDGAGGIDYRAVVEPARTRRWEARLELEGLWSDTVAP